MKWTNHPSSASLWLVGNYVVAEIHWMDDLLHFIEYLIHQTSHTIQTSFTSFSHYIRSLRSFRFTHAS